MADGAITETAPRLTWNTAFALSRRHLKQRSGKSLLVLLCLAIAVTFLMATLTFDFLVSELMDTEYVHTQALLERAGIVTGDADAMATHAARRNWILGITCLICLAGVSNSLLIAVTERFREIGTMKCLGGSDREITRLFMTEALLLGSIAGILGIGVGYIVSLVQFLFVLELGLHDLQTYVMAFVVGAPIAFIFGIVLTVLAMIYPASVASRMLPGEAMRREF